MTLRTPAFNDAKLYGFEWLRYNTEIDNQEGVLNSGDLKVTAAAGGGMRVDVAAGAALVKGDSGVPGTGLSQGLFIVVNDAAIANAVTLAAAHATLPRLDQIVLRVRDSSDLGSGADDAIIDFVTGTATSGATLDNRNGNAALPNDCLRIADVLVPAASVAVSAGNVRDRRQWSRGAHRLIARTGLGANYVTSGTTLQAVDATNLQPRLECSGAPVKLTVMGLIAPNAVAPNQAILGFWQDGAGVGGDRLLGGNAGQTGVYYEAPFWQTVITPAAGSHLFAPIWQATVGGITAYASGSGTTGPYRVAFEVDEQVRQDAENT